MTALLAFDTGTERCSVGVLARGRVRLDERATGGGEPAASAILLPTALRLLHEAGLVLADLDAIAFGRGPGAFTGLRTAASVAQGLAFGAAKPVLPIDNLLAIAEEARRANVLPPPMEPAGADPAGGAAFRVWALLDARMGEVYAAAYRHDGLRWHVEAGPLLATPEALVDRWRSEGDAGFAIAGSGVAVLGPLVPAAVPVVPDAAPTARALLALAETAWRGGEAVDAALALPLYVRDKVVETEAERQAARERRRLAEAGGAALAEAPP